MRVVLDSNIFCSDYQLKGSKFKLLFDGLNLAGGNLCIPQLVIDEVVNKFQEKLNSCHGRIAKELGTANVVSEMGLENPLSLNSIIKATTDYREKLTTQIERLGTISSYPEVPHEHLVRRALRRTKPFREGGQGYRDALIWESVMSLAEESSEPVAFISENRKDFSGSSGLHPELVAELVARKIDPQEVLYYESLEGFLAEQIKPALEAVDLNDQLRLGRFKEVDILGYIAENIPVLLSIMDLEPEEVGFPSEFQNPTVTSVRDVQVLDVEESGRVTGEEIYVSMTVKFDCDISFDVSPANQHLLAKENVYTDSGARPLSGTRHVLLQLDVSMMFDDEKGEMTSFDLDVMHVIGDP